MDGVNLVYHKLKMFFSLLLAALARLANASAER
jgi:hypothetical protein